MPVDLSDKHFQELCARAQLPSGPENLGIAAQLDAACEAMAGGTSAVLEISKAGLHKTADGHILGTVEALLVVFRFELAIVQSRGVFKKTWEVQRIEHDSYADPIGDQKSFSDKAGEFAIQFSGAGSAPLFRLAWSWFRRTFSDGVEERLKAAKERDRILSAITAAKSGDFTLWGQVLNQAERFAEDFYDAHGKLTLKGPEDAGALWEWATEHFGTWAYPSALASAIEWRGDEIRDQRPVLERGGVSARVARIVSSSIVTDKIPAAKQIFIELGETLYDTGELAAPYNEPADFGPGVKSEPDRQLSQLDPGPSRLGALMMLGVYGHQASHPRTSEWIAAARAGVGTVPESAIPQRPLREWKSIQSSDFEG